MGRPSISRRRSRARGLWSPAGSRRPTGPGSSSSPTWASEVPEPAGGLLPTVAWAIDGRIEYALDGGVFAAGAMLEWLCRELGVAADPPALGELARDADDSGGVRVLPGLAGLGAPWWRPNARAVLAGIGGGTTTAQVARAALEGIAWRVADVVAAIRESVAVDSLRVDGGLTNEPLMLELQADAIGARVEAAGADATVLGAAALAAVGSGPDRLAGGCRRAACPSTARSTPGATTTGASPSTSAGASSCRRPPRSTRSRRIGRGGRLRCD